MNEKIRGELLAPAGSMESLKTALYFGADAVYLGGPEMQLRAESAGFDKKTLEEAVKYTHSRNKKIYITVNCFADNSEIDNIGTYAQYLKDIGADAVIVSDLGAIAAIREAAPGLDIHVSTQANCQNYKTACVYHSLGVKRVVVGREMTLEAIAEMKNRIPNDLEIEAFVHGAMCMAYSGRCLLSSFFVSRSGNKGDCAQPCRWNYYLMEEKRQNMFIPVTQEGSATALLSSGDLKTIGFLEDIAAAGVCSFKIEGRMKSPYYVATVVNAYRHFIDGNATLLMCESELECASHRPYTSGFYFGEAKTDPNNDGLYHQTCKFIAYVLQKEADGLFTVEQRNRFCVGDTLEILSPSSMGLSFKVESITGADGESRQAAHLVQERVTINCPYELHEGDILRKRCPE